jgi:hypothetical protein
MQPASSTPIPDGLLAAITLLSENPRLGLKSKNPALHPGHNLPNFTAARGDSWSVTSESRWSWQDCGDGSGYQCWTGDYNGEENNGLFWNSQSKQWQGSDPNPPPDSDPAGMFFTGLTRAMLGQNHGYAQMGRAFMLDGLSLGMKSVAALIPFGRPAFVPANWQQKELRKGDGVKYVDPNNPHNQVILEKAKPGSSNPGQQVDYMKVLKDGQWLDANGNQVGNQTQDSHIPQGTELPPDTFGPIP